MKNRRRYFFINKPLQLRYMLYVTLPLLVVLAVSVVSLYFGIWGDILNKFTDEKIQEDLITASRMVEYEQSRFGTQDSDELTVFKSASKLGERQREIFKEILKDVNKNLAFKLFIILFFIAWGTIYISHKVAGPLFHMARVATEIQKGNYRSRIHLRKGDEGHPLATEINEALKKTDKKFSTIKSLTNEANAEEALKKIKEELDTVQTSHDA